MDRLVVVAETQIGEAQRVEILGAFRFQTNSALGQSERFFVVSRSWRSHEIRPGIRVTNQSFLMIIGLGGECGFVIGKSIAMASYPRARHRSGAKNIGIGTCPKGLR